MVKHRKIDRKCWLCTVKIFVSSREVKLIKIKEVGKYASYCVSIIYQPNVKFWEPYIAAVLYYNFSTDTHLCPRNRRRRYYMPMSVRPFKDQNHEFPPAIRQPGIS